MLPGDDSSRTSSVHGILQLLVHRARARPLGAAAALVVLLLTGTVLWRLAGSTTTGTMHMAPTQHGASAAAAAAAAGVTGRLFSGFTTRTFSGRRYFGGENTPNVQPVTIATAGDTALATCSRWGVMTTVHEPGEAVLDLAREEDWCVVVVGDEITPKYPALSTKFRFLDVAAQNALQVHFPGLLSRLPWRHFGRKNVGFLYAILHRADVVWDFDDDNVRREGVNLARPPTSELQRVVLPDWVTPHGLSRMDAAALECLPFNPYPHMGAPSSPSWPRGLPLHAIKRVCNHTFVPDDGATVAVYQSLANNEPDVDGIFRLTQPIPFNFDPKAQRTLVIDHGVLTPYNAQAQLTLKPALWTLLLPVSVHGRVSDIWRSYIAQRLMWDVGMRIAFTPPRVDQFRNPHNALADMAAEDALYFKTPELVKLLGVTWKGRGSTLQARYEELLVELYERDYLELADVELAQQWLLALTAVGYAFPPLSAAAQVPQAPPRKNSECKRITRALVTGVSGMIGSHVTRQLVLKPCYAVYGIVRPRTNLDTLVGVLDQVHLVMGDVNDAPRMYAILAELRPDYVYHFAAQAINGISYDVPQLTLDTNVLGTLNLLEGIRRVSLRTRVLLAGSSTEYGRTADVWNGPVPETAPLQPVSPYGVSKVATENLGNQYWLSFQIPVITARFFIQVGVGGTDSLAIHQFCKQIALAEAGLEPPVLLHGNIDTLRDMTDARDSAPAVIQLAEQGVPGEAYNVGTGSAIAISDLLKIAVEEANIPITARVDPSRFRVYDEKLLLADNTKLRALTGWVPSPDMRDTVTEILNYWRRKVSVLYAVRSDGKAASGVATT